MRQVHEWRKDAVNSARTSTIKVHLFWKFLGYLEMVPDVGIEPTTYRLQGGCSTPELIRRKQFQSIAAYVMFPTPKAPQIASVVA
jgi:hypothetical protein